MKIKELVEQLSRLCEKYGETATVEDVLKENLFDYKELQNER